MKPSRMTLQAEQPGMTIKSRGTRPRELKLLVMSFGLTFDKENIVKRNGRACRGAWYSIDKAASHVSVAHVSARRIAPETLVQRPAKATLATLSAFQFGRRP